MAGSLGADATTLFRFLSTVRRRQLLMIAALMPATAIAETVMVGSLVPFLALLTGQALHSLPLPFLSTLIDGSAWGSPVQMAAGMFVAAAISTAVLRIALTWNTDRVAFGIAHELTIEIQRRLLAQSYLFHVSRHSSELLASLDKVDQLALSLIMQLIQAASAALIGAFIIAVLIRIDAESAAIAALLVITLYLSALFSVRGRLARNAAIISSGYEQRIRSVQESLGAIRDIILDRSQPTRLEQFQTIDERFMRARSETSFLAWLPRFLVETIGLILVALIALVVAGRPGGLPAALPILGALALGAQRLLPLAGQLFGGWASLAAARPVIADVADLLRLPAYPDDGQISPLPLAESVEFENVSFRYPDRNYHALSSIDLTIPKGSRVALVGRTGSGKSTLVDLLMGLIEPDNGAIKVDGAPLTSDRLPAWRAAIAHVPQSAFLIDASIARNIALEGEIDDARVAKAAGIAQLDRFVELLPHRYETMIGERGVRLSGGQRQRLALARAVYKDAPLLVLDEATSALDEATEAAVLEAIDELAKQGRTIVIIAHRPSTIARCDLVYQLEDGAIARAGTSSEVFKDPKALTEEELGSE